MSTLLLFFLLYKYSITVAIKLTNNGLQRSLVTQGCCYKVIIKFRMVHTLLNKNILQELYNDTTYIKNVPGMTKVNETFRGASWHLVTLCTKEIYCRFTDALDVRYAN